MLVLQGSEGAGAAGHALVYFSEVINVFVTNLVVLVGLQGSGVGTTLES